MARKPARKRRSTDPTNSPKRGRGRPSAASSEQAGNRAEGGRFRKGVSGNPGGRPKKIAEMQGLAQAHTAEAIEVLLKWMRSEDPKAAVPAAKELLDRAWGKPMQPVAHEGLEDLNLNEVRSGIEGKFARIAAAGAAAGVPRQP